MKFFREKKYLNVFKYKGTTVKTWICPECLKYSKYDSKFCDYCGVRLDKKSREDELMRDINRIEPFCEQLAEQWKQVPDMRFGQFMLNIFGAIAKERDPFYIEDAEMLKKIKNIVESWRG